MNKKGDMELETLAWWILAIVVLVIVFIGFWVLKGKGEGAITYIKEIFKFGK